MKTFLLFVLISASISALTSSSCQGATDDTTRPKAQTRWRVFHQTVRIQPAVRYQQVTRRSALLVTERELSPVAAQPATPIADGGRPSVDGVLPRLLTARVPGQMISPFAPREYGTSEDLLNFTERDPYRTDNQNRFRLQPDGIRLLTLKPLW